MSNSYYVENDHYIQSGLCLIDAFDNHISLADMNFPDSDISVEDYQKWEDDFINNAVVLSKPEQSPQRIPHYKINGIRSFPYIINEALYEVNKDDDYPDVEKEDIVIPIIGGINGFDFSELLEELWNTEGSLFDYQATVEDYYFDLILEQAKEE